MTKGPPQLSEEALNALPVHVRALAHGSRCPDAALFYDELREKVRRDLLIGGAVHATQRASAVGATGSFAQAREPHAPEMVIGGREAQLVDPVGRQVWLLTKVPA